MSKYKHKKKNKNLYLIMGVITIFLLTLCMGYSVFTDTLTIQGRITVNPQEIEIPPEFNVSIGAKLLSAGQMKLHIMNYLN